MPRSNRKNDVFNHVHRTADGRLGHAMAERKKTDAEKRAAMARPEPRRPRIRAWRAPPEKTG